MGASSAIWEHAHQAKTCIDSRFLAPLQIGLSILKTLSSVGKSAKKSQFARLNHTFGKMKILNMILKN